MGTCIVSILYEHKLTISLLLIKLNCRVGELLAERAAAAGIEGVSWKRKHGQRFHGRVATLINSMQESGLKLV